ncbi:lysostaphin resistance A-like protein, partial [Massilistercora timonensis]
AKNPDLVNQATMDQSKISDLYQQLMGEILQVTTIVEGVAALVTIPVLLVMFHKDRLRERMAGIVPNKKAPLWKYFALILMVLGISLGFNNLVLIGNLSSYDAAYEQTISLLYAAPFAAQIICLGVLVPMCEELVFRGLMFKRLRERAPFWQAALYASAVFAFLHMNMIQMIYGFLLGMVFCYIYEKYGSVKAPVAAHIAVNLLSVFATQFHLFDWLLQEPMRAGVITVVCAAVASSMYLFIQRIEEKPDLPDAGEGSAARV